MVLKLKGKMLGLIGLGKIGTQVAKVAKAFGMEVCAWSENLIYLMQINRGITYE